MGPELLRQQGISSGVSWEHLKRVASRRVVFRFNCSNVDLHFFKLFCVFFCVLSGLVMAMSKFQIVQTIAGSVTFPLKVMASGAFLRACLLLL